MINSREQYNESESLEDADTAPPKTSCETWTSIILPRIVDNSLHDINNETAFVTDL
jgi:hypothetical protein